MRAVISLVFVTAACSSPAQRFGEQAAALGLRTEVVPGTEFMHVVYRKDGETSSRTIIVYIGSDGTPWVGGQPAKDPTPRNPLVLRLLTLDPGPAIYLGRPCYHRLVESPPCSTGLWTSGRYSERVVSSMAAALRRILDNAGYRSLAWFGYSGGGTLAMLLAPRFRESVSVVTVAANLDIDAWAVLHGYSALEGSLNPALQPPLPQHIRQRHFAGDLDKVVPPSIVAKGVTDPETLTVVASYDHICCWEDIWPEILVGLRHEFPLANP